MPKVHLTKRRNQRLVRVLWSAALILLAMIFVNSSIRAEDSTVEAAKKALEELAKSGDLLKLCPQYRDLQPNACTQADKAGDGLRCPSTRTATGGRNEDCEIGIMKELKGALGVNGRARLEASSLDTARMRVDIEPIESVAHDHQQVSKTPADCGPDYIKRKDFVKFLFAVYKAIAVTVGMSDLQFAAQVTSSEGFTHKYQALTCGREKHTGHCGPEGGGNRNRTPNGNANRLGNENMNRNQNSNPNLNANRR